MLLMLAKVSYICLLTSIAPLCQTEHTLGWVSGLALSSVVGMHLMGPASFTTLVYYDLIVDPEKWQRPAESSGCRGKCGMMYFWRSPDHPLISTSVALVSTLSGSLALQVFGHQLNGETIGRAVSKHPRANVEPRATNNAQVFACNDRTP